MFLLYIGLKRRFNYFVPCVYIFVYVHINMHGSMYTVCVFCIYECNCMYVHVRICICMCMYDFVCHVYGM